MAAAAASSSSSPSSASAPAAVAVASSGSSAAAAAPPPVVVASKSAAPPCSGGGSPAPSSSLESAIFEIKEAIKATAARPGFNQVSKTERGRGNSDEMLSHYFRFCTTRIFPLSATTFHGLVEISCNFWLGKSSHPFYLWDVCTEVSLQF